MVPRVVIEGAVHRKLVGLLTKPMSIAALQPVADAFQGVVSDHRVCQPLAVTARQLKKRAGNSTRIARRACPLRTRRATNCDARSSVPNLRSDPAPAATAARFV